MKQGRTLTELAMELDRQSRAKKDYLVGTTDMVMDADQSGARLTLSSSGTATKILLGINSIAHDQIGQAVGIPAKYYDRMSRENPELLAQNVNSWFRKEPKTRMVRTMDGTARAFLSDKYRRIDNYEIASTVLPVIADMGSDVRVESCEITDRRMYIKVVNPRITAEVTPGDIVQSGIIISNSEVGLGSMAIQPLVYRLVCTNGMVVNDAATRKYHIGRGNEAAEDFSLYTSETMKLSDMALMAKIRDTVKAVAEQSRFDRVVEMMKTAKEAKITGLVKPLVELGSSDFGYTKNEGENILDHLIRGGDLSLYGFANAVTRAAQDVDSYDRSTEMESIGYTILGMSGEAWRRLNNASADGKVA